MLRVNLTNIKGLAVFNKQETQQILGTMIFYVFMLLWDG